MHEPIRAMWEEFSAGFETRFPEYEIGIAKRAFIAGAQAMFSGILMGSITPMMAKTIMRELNTFWAKLEAETSEVERHERRHSAG